MKALRLLFGNLSGLRAPFFLISVVSLLDGFASFLIPVILAKVTPSLALKDAPKWILILTGIYLFSIALQWILRRHAEALGPRFVLQLKRKYFEALESLPVQTLLTMHSAYVLSLIGRVADGLGGILIRVLWGWIRSIIALILFFYFTAIESVPLAVVNLGIMLVFVWASTKFSRRMVPLSAELNTGYARLYESYADFAANVGTVKRLGIREFADSRIDSRAAVVEGQIERLQFAHATRWFLLHFLYGAAFISTMSYLIYRVAAGENSPAILVLFIAAFTTLRIHAEGISEDVKGIMELDGFIGTLDEICSLRSKEESMQSEFKFESLELAKVSFTYPAREQAIQIGDFELKRGDKVLISGESGQGKSTLLGLVGGILRPQSGTYVLNGKALADSEAGRKLFALASQESELFSLSVRDNVCLGRDVPENKLQDGLVSMRLEGWLSQLPKGIETEVGERGMRVSSGQKQRLNLLRAVFLDREVYLLDEPTSHLDPDTEHHVAAYLTRVLRDKTVVIVSHRGVFEQFCQRKFQMSDGKLTIR